MTHMHLFFFRKRKKQKTHFLLVSLERQKDILEKPQVELLFVRYPQRELGVPVGKVVLGLLVELFNVPHRASFKKRFQGCRDLIVAFPLAFLMHLSCVGKKNVDLETPQGELVECDHDLVDELPQLLERERSPRVRMRRESERLHHGKNLVGRFILHDRPRKIIVKQREDLFQAETKRAVLPFNHQDGILAFLNRF